jgi:hypothetical protein
MPVVSGVFVVSRTEDMACLRLVLLLLLLVLVLVWRVRWRWRGCLVVLYVRVWVR